MDLFDLIVCRKTNWNWEIEWCVIDVAYSILQLSWLIENLLF